MKPSVKNLMPIPKGHIVLARKQEQGKTVRLSRDHGGYEHLLAEYADGTTDCTSSSPTATLYQTTAAYWYRS